MLIENNDRRNYFPCSNKMFQERISEFAVDPIAAVKLYALY